MMMAFRSLSRRGACHSVRNFSSHTQGFMPVQAVYISQSHTMAYSYQPARLGVPFNDTFVRSQALVQWLQYPHWQASVRRFASGQGESLDVVVPFMGEAVQDGRIAWFLKKPGDQVEVYDVVALIDTFKATVDVRSSGSGVLEKLMMNEGDTVTPGTIVAIVAKGKASKSSSRAKESDSSPADARGPDAPSTAKVPDTPSAAKSPEASSSASARPTLELNKKVETPKREAVTPPSPSLPQLPPKERERRVPMTRLRKRVAARLKDSQNTFALLTTFNEIDM